MMKNKMFLFGLLAFVLVMSTGCADNVDIHSCIDTSNEPSGFWYGAWHSMISVPAFIISLFDNSVAIYDVNNNGWAYNFGFVFGLSGIIRVLTLLLKVIV